MPNGHPSYDPHFSHRDFHRIEEEEREKRKKVEPLTTLVFQWIKDNLPSPVTKTDDGSWKKAKDIDIEFPNGKLSGKVENGGWDLTLIVINPPISYTIAWDDIISGKMAWWLE